VVAIPVSDIPPTEVCLAWKAERQSEAIDAFLQTARTVFSGQGRQDMLKAGA
jgi:hypothetical protein